MDSYLPVEWQDDERMRILMGPMPSSNNLAALNGRITFWRSALHSWAKHKDGMPFTVSDACMAFRRGTQHPQCLEHIFEHLKKTGVFVSYYDIVKPIPNNESWVAWSLRALLTSSSWAWNKFKFSIGLQSIENEVFIDIEVLQEICDNALGTYWGTPKGNLTFDPEDIITAEQFYQCFKNAHNLKPDDLVIVLQYLTKMKKIAVIERHGTIFVKVAKPIQTEPLTIGEMEIAEYQLRTTALMLENRVQESQEEAAKLQERAKQLVKIGSKAAALSCLRRKKRCEKSTECILTSLENVSNCLNQIQESNLNANVLTSFKTGLHVLKSSVASMDGVEGVEATMDTYQELLSDCQSISDALALGGTSSDFGVGSDAELEEELKQLERSFQEPSEYEEQFLPDVPQNNPLRSPIKIKEMGLHNVNY